MRKLKLLLVIAKEHQKFPGKEEPRISQNQQQGTVTRFLQADSEELGTYRESYCHSIQTHPLLQFT